MAKKKPDAITPEAAQLREQQAEAKKDPKRVAWDVIGWNDGTYSLDARTWWQMLNVTPRNAAMLLCQLNPLRVTDDPNGHSSDETPQGNFGRLLLVFEDVAQADKQAHTLRQWRDIAKSRGLKYHSWIDEYERALQYLQKDADDRRNAGCCSISEAATELKTKSGAAKAYWRALLEKQVEAGTVSLRNPKDYADPVPYAIPQGIDIDIYYDQVSVHDVDAWLAAHPELGNFRIANQAEGEISRKAATGGSDGGAAVKEKKKAGRKSRRTPEFEKVVMEAANALDARFIAQPRPPKWISENGEFVSHVQNAGANVKWFGKDRDSRSIDNYAKQYGIEQRYITSLILKARRNR